MKIYVAGKFEERDKIKKIMNKLESMGHKITWDWTQEVSSDNESEMFRYAMDDYIGVMICDICIIIALRNHMYRGSMTEMGIALARGKQVWVIGHAIDNNIFIHIVDKKFNNIREMYKYLKEGGVNA